MSALASHFWEVQQMQEADLNEVLTVEARAYAFPWTQGIFRDCLQAGYRGWVLRGLDGMISAYAMISMAVGEAHVLNLCVDPDRRRQGMARLLLQHILQVARSENICVVILEVRRSNRAAIKLYQGFGFRNIGTRKDYYPAAEGREDAFVLALDLV
ncbi:MAG: ribosomal protein S18-alanine N-acetyltransferase [Panacagrimonas sp.]